MVTSVTGYTADRMQAIEDNAIVDGEVVGDNLILTRYNATTINAGNVRGAVGPMNPDGNPAGTIIMGGWTANFTGYLVLNGQTVVGGVAANPTVAAMYPSWVVGADLVLPESLGSVPMGGATPGVVSGAMTHVITTLNLPPHTHTGAPHTHTGPNHRHTIAHGHGLSVAISDPGHSHPAGGYELNSNDSTGKFYTRVGTSGSNFDWYDPGAALRTQWAAYTYPPTSHASSGVSVSGSVINANASNYSGYEGTGTTGPASTVGANTGPSTGTSNPVDHTPRNLAVRFAVKTG